MFVLKPVLKALEKHSATVETPVVTLMAMQGSDPYKILFTTILSARTKDQTTLPAAKRLFNIGPNVEVLAKQSLKKIEQAIYPVGFYKTKAKHVLECAQMLVERYESKVPRSIDALVQLPGVGRKTATLVLSEAFGIPAICVDTHVHRISNRLGIIATKNPAETEVALMEFLPKHVWNQWNPGLVAFGQTLCTPISPMCSTCPIRKYCKRVDVTSSR